MKIGFDCRMITHPGIGRYISSLLPELIEQAPDDKFVLFGDPSGLQVFAAAHNVSVRKWNAPIYSLWEQFPFFTGIDLLHVPHFNIPLFYRGKMVVTIHDLIYLLFPDSVNMPLADRYVRFMVGSALNRAAAVITVSNHTKKDTMELFGGRYSSKISVVHEAAGKEFRRETNKGSLADVRFRYRLAENIILYVGTVKPHKNVGTLVEVFALLKKWGLPHQLVICGRWDKKEDRLRRAMDDNNVRYLGEIPTGDLIALYSMADVLVHLSFYEGFGLTVLEAMKCGAPVVVSDSSSLPEVAGDAAYIVSPHNVKQIADTIFNILINTRLREGMIEAGFQQVKQFSWGETARKTLHVYRNIYNS